MSFINSLKIAGIKLTDKLNALNDPFQEFTRLVQPKYPESLPQKVVKFEQDLYANFLIRGGTIVNYRIPLPVGSPLDLGDQALWHGIATGIEALRFKQTGDDSHCEAFIQGLADQQPNGMLLRGLAENVLQKADASNDQATGHLFGLFGMWAWGPENLKAKAATLMDQWATNISTHNNCLVNPDGVHTTFGQLIQGWKTDPLNLTLCMAIYAAAYNMTNDSKYLDAFKYLRDTYGNLAQYPKVKLWWIDTHYDTHRAAIHLAILACLAKGMLYFDGLLRIRDMVAKQGNIWVNALCRWGTGIQRGEDAVLANKVLSEFTLEDKQYNIGKVNHTDKTIPSTIWNGIWVGRQPPPRWKVSAQDFFWQRDLNALDFRDQDDPADSRYNGMDFLAAYRMCLLTEILT